MLGSVMVKAPVKGHYGRENEKSHLTFGKPANTVHSTERETKTPKG